MALAMGYIKPAKNSVFDILNHCRTRIGARALRCLLLDPFNSLKTIVARQNAVKLLLQNESIFFDLLQLLPYIQGLDALSTRFSQVKRMHNAI